MTLSYFYYSMVAWTGFWLYTEWPGNGKCWIPLLYTSACAHIPTLFLGLFAAYFSLPYSPEYGSGWRSCIQCQKLRSNTGTALVRRRPIRKDWKERGFQPRRYAVFKVGSYYYSSPEELHAELTKSRAFSLWLLFSSCFSKDKSALGSVKSIFLKHSW